MSRGKLQKDIHQEIKENLKAKERFSESKYEAKRSGTAASGIYSYSTAKAYNREAQRFAEYVKEHSPQGRFTPLEAARGYARDYIAEQNARSDISAYTVKLERSALAKLFGCRAEELGSVKERSRADITRSRERTVTSEKTGKQIKNQSTRAGHFSEKNHEREVSFAKSTGLRRSEMEQVRGNQLVLRDGKAYIQLEGQQCKGGQPRELPVIGNVDRVIEIMREAGNEKVFDRVPAAMDVHHYRSQYATELYKSLARPIEQLDRKEKYFCRGDLKGVVYDRSAMLQTSEALGHHRISVIAEHYLR